MVVEGGTEGVLSRGSGVVSVCPGLSPIIRFLCDLSYWSVWKLLRWDEPRLWPPQLLGGQTISRHQLSPSASVSQRSPNLFGKQTTLLSLVSKGLLRVRGILFSYRGTLGRSGGGEGQCRCLMWLCDRLLYDIRGCESHSPHRHRWVFYGWAFIACGTAAYSSGDADRCWTRVNIWSHLNVVSVFLWNHLKQVNPPQDNYWKFVCMCVFPQPEGSYSVLLWRFYFAHICELSGGLGLSRPVIASNMHVLKTCVWTPFT